MGELTGELAERFKRLREKHNWQDDNVDEAKETNSSPSPSNNGDKSSTMSSKEDKSSAEVKRSHNKDEKPVETTPSSSPTSTRPSATSIASPASSHSSGAALPKRRSSNSRYRSMEARLANRFPQKRQEKENVVGNEKSDSPETSKDGERLQHVSSDVSSINVRSVSDISAETSRAGNTTSAANSKPNHISSITTIKRGTAIETEQTSESKGEDNSGYNTDDSFPALDWNAIEKDAKTSVKDASDQDSPVTATREAMMVEAYNPEKDTTIPVPSADLGDKLNAILEEQADTIFKKAEEKGATSSENEKEHTYSDFTSTYEAIQLNKSSPVNEAGNKVNSTEDVPRAGSNISKERAYHRPHTGEKVVVEEENLTRELKSNFDVKDDGDSKSETSGISKKKSKLAQKYEEREELSTLASDKKKKKKRRSRPKPKRTAQPQQRQSRQAAKDSDPLGRAVSMAFDQIAGYAGHQEDMHSVVDENTVDEEDYYSDESESLMADLHEVLLSTFGCNLPPSTMVPAMNDDDDTLETDGGSKVSVKSNTKYAGHVRTGSHASDSLYSEPDYTIPSAPSYDKTEGTDGEDTVDKVLPAEKAPPQTPKFKVPEAFDGKPPNLPKMTTLPRVKGSSKGGSSIYSDHTNTYMDFVEKEHDAVNLLEEADNLFFSEDTSRDILKVANKNVDKFVASIQDFLALDGGNKQNKNTPQTKVAVSKPLNTATSRSISQADAAEDKPSSDTAADNIVSQADRVGLAETAPRLVAVEPAPEDFNLSAEAVEVEEDLFAMPQQNDASSAADDSSQDTLEELKMSFVEEARRSPTIEDLESSPHQKAVEEEKKDEEVDDEFLKLLSERNLFSQADEAFNFEVETQGEVVHPESDPPGKIAFTADFDEDKQGKAESNEVDEGSDDEMFAVHPSMTRKIPVPKEETSEIVTGEEIEVTDSEEQGSSPPLVIDTFQIKVEDLGNPHSDSSTDESQNEPEPVSPVEQSFEDFAAIVTMSLRQVTREVSEEVNADAETESSGDEVDELEEDEPAEKATQSKLPQDPPADIIAEESEKTSYREVASATNTATQQWTDDFDQEISEQIEVARAEEALSPGSVVITTSSTASPKSQQSPGEIAEYHAARNEHAEEQRVARGEIELDAVDVSALTAETTSAEPIVQVPSIVERRDQPPSRNIARPVDKPEAAKKKKSGVFKGLLRPFAKKKSSKRQGKCYFFFGSQVFSADNFQCSPCGC